MWDPNLLGVAHLDRRMRHTCQARHDLPRHKPAVGRAGAQEFGLVVVQQGKDSPSVRLQDARISLSVRTDGVVCQTRPVKVVGNASDSFQQGLVVFETHRIFSHAMPPAASTLCRRRLHGTPAASTVRRRPPPRYAAGRLHGTPAASTVRRRPPPRYVAGSTVRRRLPPRSRRLHATPAASTLAPAASMLPRPTCRRTLGKRGPASKLPLPTAVFPDNGRHQGAAPEGNDSHKHYPALNTQIRITTSSVKNSYRFPVK